MAGWRLRGYRMAAGDRRWHHGGGPVLCISIVGPLYPALVPTDSFRLGRLETPSPVIWVGSAAGNRLPGSVRRTSFWGIDTRAM